MKNLIHAAVITLFAASAAHAQQAVQWKVSDGGNGHWYARVGVNYCLGFDSASGIAATRGGKLACLNSAEEWEFVRGVNGGSAFIGAAEPTFGSCVGFYWTDGSSVNLPQVAWCSGSGVCGAYWERECLTVDASAFGSCVRNWHAQWCSTGYAALVEWDADCNNDGIVDYGQIGSGTLRDGNGNGVPDCCESGVQCCVADLFADQRVNGADLGILLAQWGSTTGATVSDFNADGNVDGADLGLLLSNWGPCPI